VIQEVSADRVLGYHLGKNSRWCVKPGDRVQKGSPIARGERWLHAASSGVVTRLDTVLVVHVDVQPDQRDSTMPPLDAETVDAAELVERVHSAGIEGLGGGGYPTHLKLLAALRNSVHTIVINAVECESGISCDSALAQWHAHDLLPALIALHHLPGVNQVTIACSEITRPVITGNFDFHELSSVRPTDGEERHLLKRLFNVDLPRHLYPVAAGYLVINIGTLLAISEALAGKPLTRRLVTLTDGVRWLPIGLPVASLVATPRYRSGGPLSGVICSTSEAYVDKTANAISEFNEVESAGCIRCGRCDDVCPEALPVTQLLAFAGVGNLERLSALDLGNCIECGLCNPVCPSQINVLAGLRTGLGALHAEEGRTTAKQTALARSTRHAQRLEEFERFQADRRAARLARIRDGHIND
jgi:Na+-translocating ferredoxin:NAD+ oxidoreductase subunit C